MERNRVVESDWTTEVIGEETGTLPARAVMIKQEAPGGKYSFSTHIETLVPGDDKSLIWGHYDMSLTSALKDYYRRLCRLFNCECALDELDQENKEDEPVKDKLVYGIHESDIDQAINDYIEDWKEDKESEVKITPEQRQQIIDRVANQDFSSDYEAIRLNVDDVLEGRV